MCALPGIAGAVAGWIFVFALAAVALFWLALASRQTSGIPDVAMHLGLPASIRSGGFPPELPWTPGAPAPYHYGVDLLGGLLAPPSGPDPAFVQEMLGAYAWISLVLVVATALLRRVSGLAVLVTTPLLLTAGAWTFDGSPARIVEVICRQGSRRLGSAPR